jgi:hypothetical protein
VKVEVKIVGISIVFFFGWDTNPVTMVIYPLITGTALPGREDYEPADFRVPYFQTKPCGKGY